jgi:hypothetical protein
MRALYFWFMLSALFAHYMEDVDEEIGETSQLVQNQSKSNFPSQTDVIVAMEPSTDVQRSCFGKPVIAFTMVTMGIVIGMLLALLGMWLANNY